MAFNFHLAYATLWENSKICLLILKNCFCMLDNASISMFLFFTHVKITYFLKIKVYIMGYLNYRTMLNNPLESIKSMQWKCGVEITSKHEKSVTITFHINFLLRRANDYSITRIWIINLLAKIWMDSHKSSGSCGSIGSNSISSEIRCCEKT